MDISTIIGLVLALIGVFVGMIMKGVSLGALNNPAAFLIIILGTFGAVIIATPGNEIKNVGKLFGKLFSKNSFPTPEQAIKKILGMAEDVKKNGILSLEAILPNEKDPFIIHGINLLLDGANNDKIYDSLGEDISAMESRHAAGAQIFTQAGTYAPTLGVLGAVVGLIAALGNMEDVEALGHAISAAFVATLLGIFTGYVLWHPFANRLKRKSRQEVLIRTIYMTGITSISMGTNPKMLRDDLMNYIPSTKRSIQLNSENGK